MKNSVLISLFLLLFCKTPECQGQPSSGVADDSYSASWKPLIPQDFDKGLFRMTFDISRNHITGLLMIKRISANSIRMVFTNEIGIQFFDLEFEDDKFIIHSIFPSMNRHGLLTLLEKDFRIILFQKNKIKKISVLKSKIPETEKYLVRTGIGTFTYFVDAKTKKIIRINTNKSIMAKAILAITHNPEGLPNQIGIYNPTQKLRINLLLISN